ncbi:hypothetical protein TSA66_00445 [Noviherbaspirillum autotrophicum]|uniref:Uncharacterized protein n=1 Tax=Noviherbaspirillum autotrophicum TaxID=709839 RepID=A0A0C2BSC4_9BURK|nr:hypothetical protein TSA66_00445 [Noviherbaspirillum autotrophicum]
MLQPAETDGLPELAPQESCVVATKSTLIVPQDQLDLTDLTDWPRPRRWLVCDKYLKFIPWPRINETDPMRSVRKLKGGRSE